MLSPLTNDSRLHAAISNVLQHPEFKNFSNEDIWHVLNNLNFTGGNHISNITGDNGDIIYDDIRKYSFPPIFIFGVIGNILNIFVMSNKEMKKQPANIFFIALSVTDTLVLVFGLLPQWIVAVFLYDVRLNSNILCKLTNYFLYSFSHMCAWLVVMVTVTRYVAVCKPFLATTFCTKSKVIKSIVFVIAFFLAINLHLFRTVELTYGIFLKMPVCDGTQTVENLSLKILPIIDGSLYSTFPSFVLFVLNYLIIRKLLTRNTPDKKLPNLRKISQSEIQLIRNTPDANVRNVSPSEIRLTKILLSVSIAFVVTTIPISAFMIVADGWKSSQYEIAREQWVCRAVADIFMYLNHSINIILYSVSGSKLRKILFSMFGKKQNTRKPSVVVMTRRNTITVDALELNEIGGNNQINTDA